MIFKSKTEIGNNMIEAQLLEKSDKLGISMDELIERYIKMGLYIDDYYEPPELTREEAIESIKKDAEEDRKNGIPPQKHDSSVFINRWSKSKDKFIEFNYYH